MRPVGRTAKFSKMTLVALNSLATALVDILAVSMSTADICGFVTRVHILEWPFIIPSMRCSYVMIIFNLLLDMSHLSGGWIILAN